MTSILTPSIILLMIGNTIAASGAALVAWQTSLLRAPEPCNDDDSGGTFFPFERSATNVGTSRAPGSV
ncbi:MAG: hypothetical protein Q8M18_18020 [Bradyrhizobium sp.]|nr:hypothetical protein [Bradyrhizobium sp.]